MQLESWPLTLMLFLAVIGVLGILIGLVTLVHWLANHMHVSFT